jgi:hypothetical protein
MGVDLEKGTEPGETTRIVTPPDATGNDPNLTTDGTGPRPIFMVALQ